MADSFVPDPEPTKDSFVPDPEPKAAPDWLDRLGYTKENVERRIKKPILDKITKPEGVMEHVAKASLTAPMIAGGGSALAGLASKIPALSGVASAAPMAGRVATAGAVGAGESALKGDSALYGFLVDAIVAGMTEGAISGASALPKIGPAALGAPARAFEWAKAAPGKALDALASRLPKKGKWVNAPSLSKTPMTPKESVEKLADLVGTSKYAQAREEIAHEFTRLDMQTLTGPKPFAGDVFKMGTKDAPKPSALASGAERVRELAADPGARAAADAVTTEEPNAVLGAALSMPGFGDIAGKLLRSAVAH